MILRGIGLFDHVAFSDPVKHVTDSRASCTRLSFVFELDRLILVVVDCTNSKQTSVFLLDENHGGSNYNWHGSRCKRVDPSNARA
jgi:hypothetical protein